MSRRVVFIAAALFILLLATALPAFAQTTGVSGTIAAGTPLTGGRPNNNGTGCSTLSGGTYYYELQTFVPPVSGVWRYIDSSYGSGGLDLWVSFYTGTFDPADPLGNGCFANFDDYGEVTLTAGQSYTLMVSTNGPNATGSYSFVLTNDPPTTGTLSSGPTLSPGRLDNNSCTTISGTYYFTLSQFTPTVSGLYTYADVGYETGSGLDIDLAIYTGDISTFNPADPGGNGCITSFDDIGALNLNAGQTYTLMITSHNPGGTGTFYYLLVAPGGAAANAFCPLPLPSGSVVREIPAGAPLFYGPSLDTQLSYNLPAGTWWTTGTSGDFTHVWIACGANMVWVPTNAVAP